MARLQASQIGLAVAALAWSVGSGAWAAGPLQKLGKAEGPGRHRRVARLHRARRDRQELRLGDRVREEEQLQGQREDRRHLRRDGGADERRRLRPRHRVGRRIDAAHRRQARAADQREPHPELQERGRAAAEGAVALRQQHPLRRAVPMGLERADVQHQRLQGPAAHELEGGVRGDRRCPTARATRAACRPSTDRSTSPTPRST